MRKIITLLRPFDKAQQIIVYDNGNKLDIKESDMENLTTDVCAFVTKYECGHVDLAGPKEYAKKIAEGIKTAAVTQYGLNDLEVDVI